MPQISCIDFWKRNPNSVETIDFLEIAVQGKNWILDNKKGKRPLSQEEIKQLQEELNQIRSIRDDEFRALLF